MPPTVAEKRFTWNHDAWSEQASCPSSHSQTWARTAAWVVGRRRHHRCWHHIFETAVYHNLLARVSPPPAAAHFPPPLSVDRSGGIRSRVTAVAGEAGSRCRGEGGHAKASRGRNHSRSRAEKKRRDRQGGWRYGGQQRGGAEGQRWVGRGRTTNPNLLSSVGSHRERA